MALLGVALLLMAFTLGAIVTWRLEVRQRRALPLWLVITQHVSWLALVAYIVTLDPPVGLITIDALWWNVMKLAMMIGSIVAFALEVRQALLHRVAA